MQSVSHQPPLLSVGAPAWNKDMKGSAYIFRKNTSNNWVQIQKLIPPAADCGTCIFGNAKIGLDGDTLAVRCF